VEVVNDDGDKVMTDVAHKQLRYLPLERELGLHLVPK
jgi:hypothetical protein